MGNEELGELERLNPRTYWNNEAYDFTPWLAEPDNLDFLGEALDLELELQWTEVNVGNYSADLVAQELNGDRKVVVENQLGDTDHDHLGKIITYAAGLGADIIAWVCKDVREEHRKALDWLNEKTDEDVGIFGLEIELWRIGDSPLAPRFNVVCSPNEWAKIVKASSQGSDLTETKETQREFWKELREYMESRDTFLSLRKPRPQHWYQMSIGRARFSISLTFNTRENRLGCELYINHDKADRAFQQLQKERAEIEDELGADLDWQALPEKQACRIARYRSGDLWADEEWEDYFEWFHRQAEAFHEAFSNRVKRLDLD